MDGKTELNPNIITSGIRSDAGSVTALNPALAFAAALLDAGDVLAGKYEITAPLSISTGEADLYICRYDGKNYAAKVYRRPHAVKPETAAALSRINSPYIAALYDSGEYNGLPFEILPYYKNGSLQGRKFDLSELKSTLIPCLNEALNILHQNGILHKDLKPSNIMLSDDGKSAAIIDFGVSSVVEAGSTVILSKTGMTPEYSAPETFRNLFLAESDYYSLGITVYELFCGHTPYTGMSADEIARFTALQQIPFPKDMPRELRELIRGVTYFDITNRNNKSNPNRRWTYREVDNWCRGKSRPIPGESFESTEITDTPSGSSESPAETANPTSAGAEASVRTETKYDFTYKPYKNGVSVTAYNGGGTKKVIVPSTIDGLPVVRIDDRVFLNRKEIHKILLPETITELGSAVFAGSGLRTAILPDAITEIPELAFSHCGSLSEISLPCRVQKIGRQAFQYCMSLKNIFLPNTVKSIEDEALRHTGITAVKFPADGIVFGANVIADSYAFPSNVIHAAFAGMSDSLRLDGLGCSFEKNLRNTFIFYCRPNSAAQKYAEKCGIEVRDFDKYSRTVFE